LSNGAPLTVNASPAPSITSISPTTPASDSNDQNVTVFGANFQQNLNVTATFPGGGSAPLSGTQIQNVTPNSFVMRITLGATGTWSIRVNNPDGTHSNDFSFAVANGAQNPAVTAIDPSVVSASSTDQDVTVVGNNFQSNLNVIVTFPSGGTSTLSGAQIRNVSATSFIMRITANAAGSWKLRVVNPDGGQGNNFNFTVVTVSDLPTISSINPATPNTSGADQDVIVNGSNFQSGLRVNVIFPSGGTGILQGTGQIQNLGSNSFTMRITLNASGPWSIRAINADGRQSGLFNFNVQASGALPTGLPTSVLSPVIGPLRVTGSNLHIADGKWEFDQHKTGAHVPGGGIHAANDTNAWDVNLYTPTNSNEDVGQPVYSTAEGDVVTYAGLAPGASTGAILIAHPNKDNPVWWSGYLHMTNIQVSLNQHVTTTTILGDIGRVGADNDHLHFVIYSGKNARGELISFNASILERTSASAPEISFIDPQMPVASDDEQELTIVGTNFQAGLAVNLSFPDDNGGLTLTPISQTFAARVLADSSARIESVSSGSVTIRVALKNAGRWAAKIINSDGGQSAVQSFTVQTAASVRQPLIFIPGIAGSRLDARRSNGSLDNLWPGLSLDPDHLDLSRDPEDRKTDPIIASDVLRNIATYEVYQPLISMLTDSTKGGYVEYKRGAACSSTSTPKPSLFLFPYDWREGNDENIGELRDLVQCIRDIYGADIKIDILAHSMGGLVARRYITSTANSSVRRLVSIGTPWLGVPKALHVLETGDFLPVPIMRDGTLKRLSWFFTGVHELTPSSAYFNLGGHPYGEDQWDINNDRVNNDAYSYDQLKDLLNSRYPDSSPGRSKVGSNGDFFHSLPGQDDWSTDTSGVEYFHFYGVKKAPDTIVKVVPKFIQNCNLLHFCFTNKVFDTLFDRGDQTVPLLSVIRRGNNKDLNAPGHSSFAQFKEQAGGDSVEHVKLTENRDVQNAIRCVLSAASAQDAKNCTPLTQVPSADAATSENVLTENSSYYVTVLGSSTVRVIDSFGNTTEPLSDSSEELDSVSTFRTGQRSMTAIMPTDRSFQLIFKSDGNPFSIALLKRDGNVVTNAFRYIDVMSPANTWTQFQLDPVGGIVMKSDNNNDGVFETEISPSFSVSGTQAADVDPPSIAFSEVTQANSQISITATDAGVGVKSIFYSLDGQSYQPYTTTLNLNATQIPIVYAFADDNVGNRSGVATFQLSPAVTLQLASSTFATNEGDGVANIMVNRVGNSAGSATTDYSTSDGSGSQRKDYIFAAGTLTFAPGETTKSFNILLVDNGFVDGDRTVNINLSNPNGAALGLVGTATLTIHDNDTSLPVTNPIDNAGFLVQQTYLDFLNRQPDQSGRDFWTNDITSCGIDSQCIDVHRINVSAAFFLSIEFQQTGYLVERLYKSAFGDATGNSTIGGTHQLPVPKVRFSDFLRDTQRIGEGVVVLAPGWEQLLETNKQAFANEFVQRSQFVSAFPVSMGADQLVDKLNANAGNPLSTLERNQLVNDLTTGTKTRAQVLRVVAEHQNLVRSEFNRAFVLMQYFGYLRRDPNSGPDADYSGYDFWLGKLNDFNGNFINAEMVKAFISSGEYRQRFAP
jgi:pimeloyl-ACP methyl ester carboxylesterase